jgi:hypothetical protein
LFNYSIKENIMNGDMERNDVDYFYFLLFY